MSIPQKPDPVKLFFAVLSAPDAPVEQLKRRLALEFSPVEQESPLYQMTESAFYEQEMGPNLVKQIWVCREVIDPTELAGIKLHTNRLEAYYATGQGRRLNIDPGFLDLARVVLATGKRNAHRLHMSGGIYEEITLLWHRNRGFESMPWTYPDYKRPEVLDFLNMARESFHVERGRTTCIST